MGKLKHNKLFKNIACLIVLSKHLKIISLLDDKPNTVLEETKYSKNKIIVTNAVTKINFMKLFKIE